VHAIRILHDSGALYRGSRSSALGDCGRHTGAGVLPPSLAPLQLTVQGAVGYRLTQTIDRLEEASRLYGRGRAQMDAGALEEAVALFRESVALEPHFKTLELLGECLDR
jgi:hypothetical protein